MPGFTLKLGERREDYLPKEVSGLFIQGSLMQLLLQSSRPPPPSVFFFSGLDLLLAGILKFECVNLYLFVLLASDH